jgi:hypothetical protein
MDYRDRLELIRSGNASSYHDFQGETRHVKSPLDPALGNPWLTIWYKPRQTIRAIVVANPAYFVAFIAILSGLARALLQASNRHLGDRVSLPILLTFVTLIGPIMGLLTVYGGGLAFSVIARVFRLRVARSEVTAAIAWGSVPYLFILLLFVPTSLLVGQELFSRFRPNLAADALAQWCFLAFRIVDLMLLIMSLVVTLACLCEVLRLPLFRTLGVTVLSASLMVIVIGLPIGLIAMLFTIPVDEPEGWRRIQYTAARSPRFAPPPLKVWGPAAQALYDAGFAVKARVASLSKTPNPIVWLELKPDGSPPLPDAYQYLGMLSELEDLHIRNSYAALHGPGFSDFDVFHLMKLSKLALLDLTECCISDFGISQHSMIWGRMQNLQELRLISCPNFNGRGLAGLTVLSRTKFKSLWLDGTQTHGSGLSAFSNFRLKELHLANTGLGDDDLVEVVELTSLEILDLSQNQGIVGPGLDHLRTLVALKKLSLRGCRLNESAIDHLTDFKTLEKLDLTGTNLSPEALDKLRKALPTTFIEPLSK